MTPPTIAPLQVTTDRRLIRARWHSQRFIVARVQAPVVERTGSRSGLAAVNGNAVALPFAAGAFDLVFIAAVLGEVPDRLACLQEVRRTLRPGGRLVVNEVRGDPDYIKATDLDRLCREAGLRLLRRRRGRLRWTCVAEFAPD